MKMNRLGRTDTLVSEICLGSMTWGTQNTYEQAAEQIEIAIEHGVNFIDTAEMYPTTPLSEETLGDTESIIGQWFRTSGKRDQIVIATKVTGNGKAWMYGGQDITAEKIRISVDRSLKRLQTDRIDLYQLHWPNRGSYHFRQSWRYDPGKQDSSRISDNFLEVLEALEEQRQAGKIIHAGLSNETCWGALQYLKLSEQHSLPRMVSVQNEYNLMNRLYDLDMAELTHHEQIGLLAFSPLAAGILSGKYSDGAKPSGSRRTLNDTLNGRYTPRSAPVCERYVKLAEAHGLEPAAMALAFCLSRPFMTSTIIGATTVEQLKINLAATEVKWSEELQDQIHAIYQDHPIPM